MKAFTQFILLLLIFSLNNSQVTAQNVVIPDPSFKNYLLANSAINTNGDTAIQVSEANAFTGTIDCSNSSVLDLTGIEAFTALDTLNILLTNITSVDLSHNTALIYLNCKYSELTSLDLSANTNLAVLNCEENELNSLILNSNPSLTFLNCEQNNLTSLDLSSATGLVELDCEFNDLTMLDISSSSGLTALRCGKNELPALDISANTALTYLSCNENQLTALDVSTNTALSTLGCGSNQLTALDVNTNTALTYLSCGGNQIPTLDLNTNTALTNLTCSGNLLTTLDLSLNTALTDLLCSGNLLTSLDLSFNTSLTWMWCIHNRLTNLNVQNGNNTNVSNWHFDARSNPDLKCIQVDTSSYSNNNWSQIDPGTVFSASAATCSGLNSITTIAGAIPNLNAYPNPTSKSLSINLGKMYNNINIEVHNTVGQRVFSNNYTAVQNLNLELEGATGIYFVKVRTEEGEATIKVVKE